jgi:transposase InsO family protein
MDQVLSGLNYRKLMVYLDDVIVYSRTIEEHLKSLREVLECFRKAGLKLKPSKCSLIQREINFLGHLISRKGIETDPAKIAAVVKWPRPTSVKEVRSFLGLASYYRRFISGFSQIAAALHALTHKNVRFVWSDKCEEAFEALKKCLTSTPILAMPVDNGRYTLDTDASAESIGAVLQQEQEGEMRVIAYASRMLSGPERNYCATRREMLAVVYFTKVFRNYLLGSQFILRTDNSALQWLRKMQLPLGQTARWLEQLEEFRFDVVHRPGRNHCNADSLSRIPCKQCKQSDVSSEINALQVKVKGIPVVKDFTRIWTEEELGQFQNEDSEIGPIKRLVVEKRSEIDWEDVKELNSVSKAYWGQRQALMVENEILYRKWMNPTSGKEVKAIVLPKRLRKQVLTQCHAGFDGVHVGAKKVKGRLTSRAYWVGRSVDVDLFIRQCNQCARRKYGKSRPKGALIPTRVFEPFERVALDVTGPHPVSKGGNRFMITIIDLFTKFAIAVPVRNHEAVTIASIFIQQWICFFGIPEQILTDCGRDFLSDVMKELCEVLGIDKLRTSIYKPSTNGAVERLHRTMHNMLAKVVDSNQKDWDNLISAVMSAYRASVHEATGLTPNMMVFGKENRMILDVILGSPETALVVNSQTWLESKLDTLQRAYCLARENLDRQAKRMKTVYDRSVVSQRFNVGDKVLVYLPRTKLGCTPKWTLFYDGPYTIERQITDVNFVVRKSEKSNPLVVHIDKLKSYISQSSTDDESVDRNGDETEIFSKRERRPPVHLKDYQM